MSCVVKRFAFTLVELLVVIAIIGVLVGMLLPAVQAAREAARRSQCVNNMKQVALSLHSYHDTYQVFPALGVCTVNNQATQRDPIGGMYRSYSWAFVILPFIEQRALYDNIYSMLMTSAGNNTMPRAPWSSWTGWNKDLPPYMCPSDIPPPNRTKAPALLNYKACVGDDYLQNHLAPQDGVQNRGLFQRERWLGMSAIIDGTSNTVMLAEMVAGGRGGELPGGVALNMTSANPAGCLARIDPTNPRMLTPPVQDESRPVGGRAWYGFPNFSGVSTLVAPNGPSCLYSLDGTEFMGTASSRHPGGANVAMADGSVRFVSQTVDTGNQAADDISNPGGRRSPWGVWGALGSCAGGEPANIQ